MKEEIKAYNNVLELIGNTPLIKLNKITQNMKGNFMQKLKRLIRDILQKTE
jgi:cystathionine beta-synthase